MFGLEAYHYTLYDWLKCIKNFIKHCVFFLLFFCSFVLFQDTANTFSDIANVIIHYIFGSVACKIVLSASGWIAACYSRKFIKCNTHKWSASVYISLEISRFLCLLKGHYVGLEKKFKLRTLISSCHFILSQAKSHRWVFAGVHD